MCIFYIFKKMWFVAVVQCLYNPDKYALFGKKNVRPEFRDPKKPPKRALLSKKNVLHQFEKLDIFVVKVDISWYRRLRSKNGCQIRIQRVQFTYKSSLFNEEKNF